MRERTARILTPLLGCLYLTLLMALWLGAWLAVLAPDTLARILSH